MYFSIYSVKFGVCLLKDRLKIKKWYSPIFFTKKGIPKKEIKHMNFTENFLKNQVEKLPKHQIVFDFLEKNLKLNMLQVQTTGGRWTRWSKDYFLTNKNLAARVQFNNNDFQNVLIIDCDHEDVFLWQDFGLPTPSFTVKNKTNNKHHHFYFFTDPIPLSSYASQATLSLLDDVRRGMTRLLNGDESYVGQIAKNPFNHELFDCITWHSNINVYTLSSLSAWAESPAHASTTSYRGVRDHMISAGRNCRIFEKTRFFAYKAVLHLENKNQLFNIVLEHAEKLNRDEAIPLSFSELSDIVKSITEWTLLNFDKDKRCRVKKSAEEVKQSRVDAQRARRKRERQQRFDATKADREKAAAIAMLQWAEKEEREQNALRLRKTLTRARRKTRALVRFGFRNQDFIRSNLIKLTRLNSNLIDNSAHQVSALLASAAESSGQKESASNKNDTVKRDGFGFLDWIDDRFIFENFR